MEAIIKSKELTTTEIFEQLKVIMKEVAPMKVIGEITMDKSVRTDYGFDSINIMEMLLKIQEKFLESTPIDVEAFIEDVSKVDEGNYLTVQQICELIRKEIKKIN